MLHQVYPIMFNSSQPSAYDGLGDTLWALPRAVCPNDGVLNPSEVELESSYYDGYTWSHPVCSKCRHNLSEYSYPVDMDERKIYFQRRPGAWMVYIETHYLYELMMCRDIQAYSAVLEEFQRALMGGYIAPWMIQENLP